jgi:DNA polymerase-3 subunit gamma/tau
MDVIEIDAASNNGVDNIRELRESVKYPPAAGRKKVYIIDEVHMLSPGASNALLKTLEEPPENVMFILATTDPQKLPQTILSRCMRLDFKRVPERVLMEHMQRICQEKGVEVTEGALRLLAANADGSVRDGLSLLDQCLAAGDRLLDRDKVLEFLGTVSEEFFINLTERVALHDVAGALVALDQALQEGKDVKQLMKDWLSHYRSLLITKYIKNAEDMLNMSTENIGKLRQQSAQISMDEINNAIVTLSKTILDARYSTQPRILLELAIVTIASGISEAKPLGTMQTAQTPRMVQMSQGGSVSQAPSANGSMAAGQGGPAGPTPSANGATAAGRGGSAGTAPSANGFMAAGQGGSAGSAPSANRAMAAGRGGSAGSAPSANGFIAAGQGGPAGQTPSAGPANPPVQDYDLDDIWNRIFERAENIRASFNQLRNAALTGINDHEFKVLTHSEFTKRFIEDNQAQICALMEEITGKHLRLVCKLTGQAEEDSPSEEMESLARAMNSQYGDIHVIVK